MSSQTREDQHVLVATKKRAAAALRDAEIEFTLGGGLGILESESSLRS